MARATVSIDKDIVVAGVITAAGFPSCGGRDLTVHYAPSVPTLAMVDDPDSASGQAVRESVAWNTYRFVTHLHDLPEDAENGVIIYALRGASEGYVIRGFLYLVSTRMEKCK